MNLYQLSVVIPTFARPEILRLTLEGLCNQRDSNSLAEVVVVNDGSDERTASVVRSFSDRLPIHYLEQPKRSVSSARNLGISFARSPVLLLLDDDVIPGPDLIGEHAKFHYERSRDDSALLGYVTWHPDLPTSPFMRWYGEYGALFGYSLLVNNQEVNARFFYSCNISLKRKLLISHGGFNENLTVLEDNELGFRLAQEGMRLFFRKSAIAYHYQTFTFRQTCERLERYSSGLNAFLATSAGRSLARKRQGFAFRSLEGIVKIVAPMLSPLLYVVDTNVTLPNSIYRLFYWYYGAHKSFWARADRELLLTQNRLPVR
jgi:glycosyltransferase involved in cell wall biosynthesis